MVIHHVLAASYSSRIYTLAFDISAPSLTLSSSLEVGHHPSWLTPHPSDPTTVFAGIEQADGRIVEIKYDAQCKGTIVTEISSGGSAPCSLAALKGELIVGNYGSGNVVTIPLSSSSPYLPTAISPPLQLQGSGPNLSRQLSSHPHHVVPHPTRDEVLVPDLGADKTWRLIKGPSGWEVGGWVEYQPGGGPRHVAVGELLYTVLELTNSLAVHRLPPLPEEPTFLSSHPIHIPPPALSTQTLTLRTLPFTPAAPSAQMLAAEILLPPTNPLFPTPFLYVSNRNIPLPSGDTIAIFDLSPSSTVPTMIREVPTGLYHLRGMIFFGPDSRYLIAGGVNGGEGDVGVKVFERIEGGRDLKEVAGMSAFKEGEVVVDEAENVVAPTGFLAVGLSV